tara:strand:- start:334 stop:438 length:105 start_codon:yes stop_codon:yes gene_type:complete
MQEQLALQGMALMHAMNAALQLAWSAPPQQQSCT